MRVAATWIGASAALGMVLALGACPGPPCGADLDCESGSYCALPEGGAEGNCAQDCNDFFGCPEGSFCNVRGRCQLAPEAPVLRLTEPSAAVEGEPGARFRVAGEVEFRGDELLLSAEVVDWRGCDPAPGLSVSIRGDVGETLVVPFELPEMSLPDGGGQLRVAAELGSFRVEETRGLLAGQRCEDCPRVSLTAPGSGALEERLFFTRLAGQVQAYSPGTVRWSVGDGEVDGLVSPLSLSSDGRLADVLVPLELGRNWVAVRAANAEGETECRRYLDTTAPSEDRLAVTLGWSSGDADLDLFLVPPGGQYGTAACSAALSEETRFDACTEFGDSFAFGPETLAIPATGPPGAYGVLVVGFSAAPQQSVQAYVRVFSHGRQLAALGPRELVPSDGEIWVVGVATVGVDAAGSTFVSLDELIDHAPTRTPEGWPPY